ncbi:MAG: HAD family hydrolase [Bacilli bacterium]|nr:HAD family hydrolase [Bacilli bacterium]
MAIRYFIYDLDDTLVSDILNQQGAFKALLKFMKIPYTDELFLRWHQFDRDYWGKEIYKTISIPLEYQKNKESYTEYVRSQRFSLFFDCLLPYSPFLLNRVYQNGLFDSIVPMEDAYETVSTLAPQFPSYIATNGVFEVAKHKLKEIRLEDFFQDIFSADMTSHTVTKARLEFWEELIETFHIKDTQEYLVIGDNYRDDVCVPKQLGFQTCWLSSKEIPNFQGDYQIKRLRELKKIV